MTRPDEINRFWLDEVGEKGWYEKSDALDQTIRDRFLATWERAADLADDWCATPEGALAFLILTDQFPRNMFRGDPRSFATDALALRMADQAIARGFDLATPEPQRQFFRTAGSSGPLRRIVPRADAGREPAPCAHAPRGHRRLRPLSLAQRGAWPRSDRGGKEGDGGRRLWRFGQREAVAC